MKIRLILGDVRRVVGVFEFTSVQPIGSYVDYAGNGYKVTNIRYRAAVLDWVDVSCERVAIPQVFPPD